MTSHAALAALAAAALVAGCNSFDPKLGDQPFLCDDAEPLCPDGYTCSERGAGQRVCELDGVGVDAGTADAMAPACRVDSAEPNDVRTAARLTPVSDQASRYEHADLSMCPGTERDMFALRLGSSDKLRVTVTGDREALELNILNEAGVYVSSGDAITSQVTEFRTTTGTTPLAPGRYYLEIFSSQNRVSDYALVIKTCVDPQPTCLDD